MPGNIKRERYKYGYLNLHLSKYLVHIITSFYHRKLQKTINSLLTRHRGCEE